MTFQEVSAFTAALAALLVAVGWLLKKAWGFTRLSVHAFETIQKELTPNGGFTTYDLVRKLKAQSDVHETRLDAIEETAQQAVTAAGLAVNEAKAGRAILTEAQQVTTTQIRDTQRVVEELHTRIELAQAFTMRADDPRGQRRLGVRLDDDPT